MDKFDKITLKLNLSSKMDMEISLFQIVITTIYILESSFNIINNLFVVIFTCVALCGYVNWRVNSYEKYIGKILNIEGE